MALAGVCAAAALTVFGAVSAVSADTPPGSTLNRPAEPVVIQQALPDQTGYAAIGSVNVQLPNRLLGSRRTIWSRFDGTVAGHRFPSRSTSVTSWT